jgi:mannosylfructose-phosphate synthase
MVVATTPQQVDVLRADYGVPEENCCIIPPGYDDNRFYPVSEASRQAIRQRLGFSGKVVLSLGRLARNKGYDLLIDAFELVVRREPDAVLHLDVGGTERTPAEATILGELKAQVARLALSDQVRFGSFIPEEDLADFYRAADLFVLSSRYEPFGMTAIEAMASGTPTVVTTHGGLFRALTFGRHALYADSLDKEALGIMMVTVLRHPRLRARLARMGAHKARSLFTWTGIAQRLIALVEHRASKSFTLTDTEWDEPWNDAD